MSYKAYFRYYLKFENDSYENKNFSIAVDSFEVDGGINQFISVNDVYTGASVELELEQDFGFRLSRTLEQNIDLEIGFGDLTRVNIYLD